MRAKVAFYPSSFRVNHCKLVSWQRLIDAEKVRDRERRSTPTLEATEKPILYRWPGHSCKTSNRRWLATSPTLRSEARLSFHTTLEGGYDAENDLYIADLDASVASYN